MLSILAIILLWVGLPCAAQTEPPGGAQAPPVFQAPTEIIESPDFGDDDGYDSSNDPNLKPGREAAGATNGQGPPPTNGNGEQDAQPPAVQGTFSTSPPAMGQPTEGQPAPGQQAPGQAQQQEPASPQAPPESAGAPPPMSVEPSPKFPTPILPSEKNGDAAKNGEAKQAEDKSSDDKPSDEKAANGKSNGKSTERKQAEKKTPPKKSAESKQKESAKQERVQSLDFQNADIADVVRAVSQLTGKNFIIDPNVRGKISIVAPSSVTVNEAYRAFLSALSIGGFTVVKSGEFYKVIPSRNAKNDNLETTATKTLPVSDQMVTRIVRLNHLSVADVNRYLRSVTSRDGELIGYEPTNTLIITDYGSNISRVLKILAQLDKPGFEERLSVVPIHFAKAKDLASLIEKIINKGQKESMVAGGGRYGGYPTRGPASAGADGKQVELSLVTPDERTNSLIVVGNQEGIDKVRTLVEELDFSMDAAEGGGVSVYRLKFSVAETIANTLNGLAQKAGASAQAPQQGPSATRPFTPPPPPLFGGDVKIVPDKTTNSVIIVAGKQDLEIVRGLIAKIDVPRDQVYVEAILMEINSQKTRDWRIAGYYLDPATKGIGRVGYSSPGTLESIFSPSNDSGAVLSFGKGEVFTITLGDRQFQIPSLIGFINFLQQQTDANILSTPQILAMDNEEAQIEVGDQVPIGIETQTTSGGVVTSAPKFEQATIKLTITPNISPESDTIRMKVNQIVKQASNATVRSQLLSAVTTIISTRALKTSIAVDNKDTIVLGGLIRDEDVNTESKVPFLGDIPVIGWLFKSVSVSKNKINLLVFLTPKIIRNNGDSRKLLEYRVRSRGKWVSDNVLGTDPMLDKINEILASHPETDETPTPAPSPTPTPTAASRQSRPQAPARAPANSPELQLK